ncbi:hypothetical protein WN943_015367 [Citrus x changshan-huyou]
MDLKTLVTRMLEKKGVLSKIRAELRANVFGAIEEEDQIIEKNEHLPPTLEYEIHDSLFANLNLILSEVDSVGTISASIVTYASIQTLKQDLIINACTIVASRLVCFFGLECYWIYVGIRVLLEDGELLHMSWSVPGYVARIRVLLEDGIATGSFAQNLAVGILALIFGNFIG